MDSLLHDLRQGARFLVRAPGLATLTILMLAVGIGADTALFSVVDGILLNPLPYHDPGRLVRVWETDASRGVDRGSVSPTVLADWRLRSRVFAGLGASRGSYFNLAGSGEPHRVIGARVTESLFETLGVAPALGRTFAPDAERETLVREVVLSHRLWQSMFGGDPDVVGQTVRVEGVPYTVVGVMPASFYYPDPQFEVWLPLAVDAGEANRSNHTLQVVGRLRTGVGLEQARRGMDSLARTLSLEHPDTSATRGAHLEPLREEIVGAARTPLLVLMAAAGFVLLIACVNVANILLGRAIGREREMTVRAALGASRVRLVRQTLIESLSLALLGGVVGCALAAWGVALLVRMAPASVPRLEEVRVDAPILGFALVVSLATGLLFGLVSSLKTARGRRGTVLGSVSDLSRSGPSRATKTARSLLVVAEVALAFVLLTGAGLMIRTFQRLTSVDLGFATEHRLALDVSLPVTRYTEIPRIVTTYDQIVERVEALPGVESAGLVSTLPLSGAWATREVTVRRPERGSVRDPLPVDYRLVSGDYLESMGIPLLRGRLPETGGNAGRDGEVVVNQSFAREELGGGDAVGAQISFEGETGPWSTVVGVVGDVRHYGLEGQPRPEVYDAMSAMPWPWTTLTLVVHTTGDPFSVADAIRGRVWEVDADLPVDHVRTIEGLVSQAAGGAHFNMVLLSLFSVIALILAAGGIFGVMYHAVHQRMHELGTRLALGATPADVRRMVLRQGLTWTAAGISLGALLAVALGRFVSSLLFGITTLDGPTFLSTMALLVVVSLVAGLVPARRAAHADPLTALRAD